MARSGTYNFNLDIDEVIQEATEMIGGEQTLGHTPQSARRSINLLLNDWQNRGVLLWSTFTTAVTVATSVTSYDLDDSVNDALVITVKASIAATETQLTRISFEEYNVLPNKSQTGRPTQFFLDRQITPNLKIWPAPENSTDTIVYDALTRIQDADGVTNTMEIPFRFYPCLTAGLAYYIAMKRAPDRIQLLKSVYEEEFERAMGEDRDRSSFTVTPQLSFYRVG